MYKILVFVLTLAVSFIFTTSPALANHKKVVAKNPTFSASMAKNKRSVTLYFNNLKDVKTITYQMTYDSNKGPQGVSGTIKPKTRNISRRILMGTCSKNVCTYHKNVTNVHISGNYTLKSGGTIPFEKQF